MSQSKPRKIFIQETPAHGLTPAHIEFRVEGFANDQEILTLLVKCAKGVVERNETTFLPPQKHLVTVPNAEMFDPLKILFPKGR